MLKKSFRANTLLCLFMLAAVSTTVELKATVSKTMLVSSLGLALVGGAQAGPILGWFVGTAARVVGYGVLAGAAAGAIAATGGTAAPILGGGVGSAIAAAAGSGAAISGATGAVASGTALVVGSSAAASSAVIGTGVFAAIGGGITSIFTSVEGIATGLQTLASLLPTP